MMVQKEVGERIAARPGKMSVLGVMAQYYAKPQIVRLVGRDCFWPRPEVESAIVRISKQEARIKGREREFFKLVKVGFSSRRKMLKNNLNNVYKQEEVERVIKDMGLDIKIRAQDLSLEEWIRLFGKLHDL